MESLDLVRQRIANACARAHRNPQSVTLVGASKTVEAPRLQEYLAQGLTHFGENYIQEGLIKIDYFKAHNLNAHWHFIGALQSNKAREAVAHFELIHSIDRLSLAKALNKEARKVNKVQRVLIQVNLGDETTKGGVAPADLSNLYQQIAPMDNLKVEGLMSLPPYNQDTEAMRHYHRRLRELQNEMNIGVELSMGMSGDYETAIEEGATFIRVGTLLFGARV